MWNKKKNVCRFFVSVFLGNEDDDNDDDDEKENVVVVRKKKCWANFYFEVEKKVVIYLLFMRYILYSKVRLVKTTSSLSTLRKSWNVSQSKLNITRILHYTTRKTHMIYSIFVHFLNNLYF